MSNLISKLCLYGHKNASSSFSSSFYLKKGKKYLFDLSKNKSIENQDSKT